MALNLFLQADMMLPRN